MYQLCPGKRVPARNSERFGNSNLNLHSQGRRTEHILFTSLLYGFTAFTHIARGPAFSFLALTFKVSLQRTVLCGACPYPWALGISEGIPPGQQFGYRKSPLESGELGGEWANLEAGKLDKELLK